MVSTTTWPVVAADGTEVTIVVLVKLETVAAVPLKAPGREFIWELMKFIPLMGTEVPTGPEVGERLEICGFGKA